MVAPETKIGCLDRLGMLRHFPTKLGVLEEIGRLLDELCLDDGEAKRLTDAVLSRNSEWPGPAKLREIHSQEIAPHRPRQDRPEGCPHCRDMGGLRRVFQVFERLPGGEERKQTIYPEGNPHEVWKQAQALDEQYRESKTHTFYDSCVAFCSCALGRWAKANEAARKSREK